MNELLEEKIVDLESQIRTNKEEVAIQRLKYTAEMNNLMVERDLKTKERESETVLFGNQLKMLELKVQTVRKEVEEKDEFIRSYLVGRSQESNQKKHINDVFECFREKFDVKMKLLEEN